MTKTKEIILRISLTGLLMGLIYLTTQFLAIPYPNGGYFNLSDSLIIFTAIYVGPLEALIAGTIACALADLIGGYGVFVGFTIVAKGLEALLSFFIYHLLRKRKHLKYVSLFIGATAMIATYFASYCILFSINYAYTSTLFDLIQGYSGALIAFSLLKAFRNISLPYKKKSE